MVLVEVSIGSVVPLVVEATPVVSAVVEPVVAGPVDVGEPVVGVVVCPCVSPMLPDMLSVSLALPVVVGVVAVAVASVEVGIVIDTVPCVADAVAEVPPSSPHAVAERETTRPERQVTTRTSRMLPPYQRHRGSGG